MSLSILGNPAAINAYLATPEGRATAQAIADAIFRDEERLAAWEAALGGELHPAVDAALQRLIDARNAGDRA